MRPEGKGSRTTLLVFSILVSLAQFDPSDGIPLCVSPFHGTQLSHPTGSSGGPKAAVRPNVCCLSPEGGRSAVVTVRAHRPPPKRKCCCRQCWKGRRAAGPGRRQKGRRCRKSKGSGRKRTSKNMCFPSSVNVSVTVQTIPRLWSGDGRFAQRLPQ